MRALLPLLVLLFVSGTAFSQTTDSLSRRQVREDLDFVARTIESVHPNPWHSISRKRFDALRDSILRTLPPRLSVFDAWAPVARLCAALDEGHTNAEFPQALVKAIVANQVPMFPLNLSDMSPEGFTVRADYSDSEQLQARDRIVSINGQSTAALYRRLTSLYGGLSAWRRVRVKEQPALLFYLTGIRGPYTFTYVRDGKKRSCTTQAISYDNFRVRREAFRKQHPVPPATNAFERLAGNVGLIRFNSMYGNPESFDSFLTRTFEEIRSRPVAGLLVDMRENGGGNSVFGWYLLQYITGKPFRMSGGVRWKVSPEVRAQIEKLDSTRRAGYANYLAAADGFIIEGGPDAAAAPDTNYLRYNGRVGVLIGPNTFSSANMTANTIGDFKLATLIGEPSGEPANDYGELSAFTTPHAALPFTTCSKYFIRANGDTKDMNPVLPDIYAKHEAGSKDDTVLEAARKWAAQRK